MSEPRPDEATQHQQAEVIDLKEGCFQAREKIEVLKRVVVLLMQHKDIPVSLYERTLPLDRAHEMFANLQLAYRHLEDARMRLGKVVQAFDGGTSCYPR